MSKKREIESEREGEWKKESERERKRNMAGSDFTPQSNFFHAVVQPYTSVKRELLFKKESIAAATLCDACQSFAQGVVDIVHQNGPNLKSVSYCGN